MVTDIRMSPTYSVDGAHALENLFASGARDVFHATDEGSCTWYEFACKAIELAGIDAFVATIVASEYPTSAQRPANSALRSGRLERVGGKVPRLREQAHQAYLEEKGNTRPQLL